MTTYIAALDQGTTSSRCIIFDGDGKIVSSGQREHEQIYPKPGWVEHDATEIRFRISQVIDTAVQQAGIRASDVAALGITNQRETAVVWEKATGNPIHGAIVWQDTRTDRLCKQLGAESDLGAERFKAQTGLPLATYFAGPKWRWILDNVDGARERAEAGELLCGTMDTWSLWNLTGGPDGGVHATDVTNASRTMLMDLTTLDWDDGLCEAIGVPRAALPEIRSSSEPYGEVRGGSLAGVQVAGILGDQQAATFGQVCFSPGEAKNTYGTGNFLLLNTGTTPQWSEHGLLTTVGYKLGREDAVYCLEGSIAVTGSLVQWVRDNLGLIKDASAIETLAKGVDDNGGVYVVPAFSGLFAPYWRSEARGAILGLTRYVRSGHVARAVLEATAFQSREVTDAMNEDSGVPLESLRVDGGMVVNETLMQFQADVLGVPVIRPEIIETTALGAAYAAGLAVGVWGGTDELRALWAEDKRWEPSMDPKVRDRSYRYWKKAVTRTFDWVEEDDED